MAEQWSAIIRTPLPGAPRLGLATGPQGLEKVEFLAAATALRSPQDPVAVLFAEQLEAYFEGVLSVFDGPLAPAPTAFQGRVRAALLAIPCGSVATYGRLAKDLRSAPRAVAGACRANPHPLIVPCHRVVAAHGPGGYMGQTEGEALKYKRWLLWHEGIE